jgi:hypothetical protein
MARRRAARSKVVATKRQYLVLSAYQLSQTYIAGISNYRDTLTKYAPRQGSSSAANGDSESVDRFYDIKNAIMNVIQMIIDKVSFDLVINALTEIQGQTDSIAKAQEVLDYIQDTILGIIVNIGQRINPSIILTRIEVLRRTVESAEELPVIFGNIDAFIMEVIDMITGGVKFDEILAQLEYINEELLVDSKVAEDVMEIENMILDIIGNIAMGIPIPLILKRLDYLGGRVAAMAEF